MPGRLFQRTEDSSASDQRQHEQEQLPFTNNDAITDSDFLTESTASPRPPPSQAGRSQSILSGHLSSSYTQKFPTRSFFHHASHGSLDSVHYSSQGVRKQTQELASWALGDTDSFRAGPSSSRPHAASDSSLHSRPRLSSLTGDSDTDVHNLLDPSVPEAIEEVSEPQSPDSQTRDVPAGSHSSALTHMLKTSSRDEAEDYMEARRRRENKDTGRNRAPSIVVHDDSADGMQEDTALLPKAGLAERSDKRQYGTTSESSKPHTGTRDIRTIARDQIAAVLHTVTSPKSWDRRMIWRRAVVEPTKTLPAVFLGWLLNILDALSYGMILFPLGEKPFEHTGRDGISMFFVSCIVSQLVFSLGGSIFKGGVGSEMIEVVPFVHKMAYIIMERMPNASNQAILATVIVSYAMSSILTGIMFLLLGLFKLGNLVSFFPRSILAGCIGGVGLFLFITGIEVSARLDGNLEFTRPILEKLFQSDTVVLWVFPLVLAIILLLIRYIFRNSRYHEAILPTFFAGITAVFYFIVAVVPHLNLDDLRQKGWVFEKAETGTPFYNFYTYYDFKLVNWAAIGACIPTMFALSFFGIIHVPINVPALAVAVQEDNVDTNRELIAHGLSNALSGLAGSIQNYLVYANSSFFIKNGGDSRLAGLFLALATTVTWFAGPGIIGYIPVNVVGTLIYMLGIELLKEALWETFGRTPWLEYMAIWIIVLVMGLHDFVVGIVAGIILACLIYVVQTSRTPAIRATYTGAIAESTVRRHPAQRRFLREVGSQIYVVKLAGYLFFGTIVSVENSIRAITDEQAFKERPVRFVVIDFLHVDGLDFSAAEAFQRMHRILHRRGIEMILSSVSPSGTVGQSLTMVGLLDEEQGDNACPPPRVFEDLNKALEACENDLLMVLKQRSDMLAHQQNAQPTSMAVPQVSSPGPEVFYNSPRRELVQQAARTTLKEHDIFTPSKWQNFAQPLPLILQTFQGLTDKDIDFWHPACKYFERREYVEGTVLYSRGDDPDGFYLLEQGILRCDYELEQGAFFESITVGTTCGELPFFSGTGRTATVVAEKDSVAWLLTKEKWEELQKDLPDVAQELMKITVKLTSERFNAITSHILVTAT